MPSLPLSTTLMMAPGTPKTLCWRTVTWGMTNSQLTLNFFETVCSSWMHISLWDPMGFPQSTEGPAWCHCSPSLHYFQWSWESGEVPVNQKLANVVPIFNKGKKKDPGNYRPANLISVPGKIWRRLFWELLKSVWKTTKSLVIDITGPQRESPA